MEKQQIFFYVIISLVKGYVIIVRPVDMYLLRGDCTGPRIIPKEIFIFPQICKTKYPSLFVTTRAICVNMKSGIQNLVHIRKETMNLRNKNGQKKMLDS